MQQTVLLNSITVGTYKLTFDIFPILEKLPSLLGLLDNANLIRSCLFKCIKLFCSCDYIFLSRKKS